MQKLHLCEKCAQSMGVGQGASFSMSDILLGKGAGEPLTRSGGSKSCPSCGWTMRQVKKVGRMGCPDCYDTFEVEIKNVLSSIHQATRHVGRRPKHLEQKLSLRDRQETLEAAIARAIEMEAYEEAAAYRDELKSLMLASDPAENADDA
ncbi:excinuclease ABC subunit B [Kiritimatiellota bacterium B12222]|nr:excinuclease ABC subunit B [Kiritimatiellota bacterium B12222]